MCVGGRGTGEGTGGKTMATHVGTLTCSCVYICGGISSTVDGHHCYGEEGITGQASKLCGCQIS